MKSKRHTYCIILSENRTSEKKNAFDSYYLPIQECQRTKKKKEKEEPPKQKTKSLLFQ